MYYRTFDEWWDGTQASTYSGMTGALQQTFKSVAKQGWDAAVSSDRLSSAYSDEQIKRFNQEN